MDVIMSISEESTSRSSCFDNSGILKQKPFLNLVLLLAGVMQPKVGL